MNTLGLHHIAQEKYGELIAGIAIAWIFKDQPVKRADLDKAIAELEKNNIIVKE